MRQQIKGQLPPCQRAMVKIRTLFGILHTPILPLLMRAYPTVVCPTAITVVAKNLEPLRKIVLDQPHRNGGAVSHGPTMLSPVIIHMVNGKEHHVVLTAACTARSIMGEHLCLTILPLPLPC